ncbi:hypothetical protein E2C01_067501 [Portunus trituberculatus]|uniref:Uncharacterized protein n=1 Tax=Portunus trituberculatus TaxID=210409 RepID=A0A5B7HST2_PORTR|nr:hypothetical protein [Portunus trituberculatus]
MFVVVALAISLAAVIYGYQSGIFKQNGRTRGQENVVMMVAGESRADGQRVIPADCLLQAFESRWRKFDAETNGVIVREEAKWKRVDDSEKPDVLY